MDLFLLAGPPIRNMAEEKETADMMVQGAAIFIMVVSVVAWFVAWRFYSVGQRGKLYYFINAGLAVCYLPFLVLFYIKCYEGNFSTGKEHYLLAFFLHSTIVVFWALGYYGKHKEEEAF